MAKKIKVSQLEKAIMNCLETYSDEVTTAAKSAVDEISDEALKIVNDHAPTDKRKIKRKGKYKRSLKTRTMYESVTEKKNVIYASGDEYRLTHLLENGHALTKGGRTAPQPHFKYGDDYINKELLKRTIKKIGGK